MIRTISALILVLALPAFAGAQEGEHANADSTAEHGAMEHQGMEHGMRQGMEHGMQQGMEHGMMGQGMAMMMAHPGPGMILQMREDLGLSEDQVARLEAMHEEAHTEMQAHMEAARGARTRAHEAMTGETPDIEAFAEALREASLHQVEAHVAMARVHLAAGDVLGADQRETLHKAMQTRHEHMMQEMHSEEEGHESGEHEGG